MLCHEQRERCSHDGTAEKWDFAQGVRCKASRGFCAIARLVPNFTNPSHRRVQQNGWLN